jgi:hypothetical protein
MIIFEAIVFGAYLGHMVNRGLALTWRLAFKPKGRHHTK